MFVRQVLLVIIVESIVQVIATDVFDNSNQINSLIISRSLGEILESCFRDHLNPLIITEQSSQYIVHEPQQASIIVINDEFRIQHDAKNYNPHRGTFVLTASSDDQLNTTMSHLQSTPWWNTESYYVLIGPAAQSCAEASKILAVMWKRKIVSVVYLCFDENKEAVMIYTFNPFNSYAPHPWKQVEVIPDKPGTRWTLYKHQYQKGRIICSAIMFDKTLNLDGYVISAIMDKRVRRNIIPSDVPISLSNYRKFGPIIGISIMIEVFTHMKVKVNITNTNGLWLSKDKQLHGRLQDLLDHDIYLHARPLYLGFQYTTYPQNVFRVVLLGQQRPFLQTETKILSFFRSNILAPIIILFFLSAFLLKINQQQEYLSALLKMWQLFLGTNIPQSLTNTPTRIFFIGVFLLVIILNGAFQSKLASFLTKPERIYVNSIEDAFNLKYHIYGARDFMAGAGYLELPADKQPYVHLIDSWRCLDQALNDSQVLCLTVPTYGVRNAKKHQLHVSSSVHLFFTVHWISPGFPLKNRINTLILRLQASGFMVRLNQKNFHYGLDYVRSYENEETKFRYRPIELPDLLFVIKFLILGLVCAVLIFIAESQYH